MLTNFKISKKTKAPACCSLSCCGNKFGRIERSEYRHDSRPNKIIKARRYAKHVEKQIVRREIQMQIDEDLQTIPDIEQIFDEVEYRNYIDWKYSYYDTYIPDYDDN